MNTTPAALLSSTALLTAAVTVTLLALLTLLFARRGRRVGDEPRCRKCGFDLTGKPETSTRCPECGADVTAAKAVVTGRRVARRRLAWTAAVVLVPALFLTGVLTYTRVKQIDWRRHAPVFMLLDEAQGPAGVGQSAALDELNRRAAATWSDESWRTTIDAALACQADVSRPWDDRWGRLVETGRNVGKTTDAQWKHYCQNVLDTLPITLGTRAVVVRGNPAPLDVNTRKARVDRLSFFGGYRTVVTEVDGHPVRKSLSPGKTLHRQRSGADPFEPGGDTFTGASEVKAWPVPVVIPEDLEGLAAGMHRLRQRVALAIPEEPKDSSGFSMVMFMNIDLFPSAGERHFVTSERWLETTFVLAESTRAPPVAFTDAASDKAVRDGVRLVGVWRKDDAIDIEYAVEKFAVRTRFELTMTWPHALMTYHPTQSGTFSGINERTGRIETVHHLWTRGPTVGRAQTVDIILKADLEAVKCSTDMTPVWGGEIRFDDVPVASAPPTDEWSKFRRGFSP